MGLEINYDMSPKITAATPSFRKMNSGGGVTSFLGLKMMENHVYTFGEGYTYIQIPIQSIDALEMKSSKKGGKEGPETGGLFVYTIVPACSVSIKKQSKFLIIPNPKIREYGFCEGSRFLLPNEGEIVPTIQLISMSSKVPKYLQEEYALRILMCA